MGTSTSQDSSGTTVNWELKNKGPGSCDPVYTYAIFDYKVNSQSNVQVLFGQTVNPAPIGAGRLGGPYKSTFSQCTLPSCSCAVMFYYTWYDLNGNYKVAISPSTQCPNPL